MRVIAAAIEAQVDDHELRSPSPDEVDHFGEVVGEPLASLIAHPVDLQKEDPPGIDKRMPIILIEP